MTQGLRAAHKLMREIESEPDHALQVRKIALQFFDATAPLHGMGRTERGLLEAAAMLHDIGLAVDVSSHHKKSRDLILENGLPGFTEDQIKMTACIARYHRKAPPRPEHKVFRQLSFDERATVTKLAALLRVADGLDRAHCGSTQSLSATSAADRLALSVEQRRPCRTDIWGALRKRGLFEETFGVKLDIAANKPRGASRHDDVA